MKKILCCLTLILSGISVVHAESEAYAYVSALQPPVWISHKGENMALGASSPVLAGDVLRTGAGAHVHVALADGSLLKLGENTSLSISRLQLSKAGNKDVLAGTLKLISGTLRYTTQKQGSAIGHDPTLQIGDGFTAAISNADAWARAVSAEDRLLLIEGTVTIESPKKILTKLTQPNTAYTAFKGAQAKPAAVETMQQTQSLLTLTDLNKQQPALQSNGLYRVVLATYPDEAKAQERVRKYAALGYPVELQRPGKTSASGFRVILDGLTNSADAKTYAGLLVERLKLLNPQVEALGQ